MEKELSVILKIKAELVGRGEMYLRVKVHPGASQTAIKGVLKDENGETIKIDIAAAPERGRANNELIKYLAKELDVAKPGVKIIAGASDRIKLIKIKTIK